MQAFRVGRNVYATQFHPELDLEGICTRIEVYKNAGYFDPSAAETLKELSRTVEVRHPMTAAWPNFVAPVAPTLDPDASGIRSRASIGV